MNSFSATTPIFSYHVALPNPQNHYFDVTLTVEQWSSPDLNLKMPVWTPGSYLVREFERHLQEFIAHDPTTGETLKTTKLSKNHWQIATNDCSTVRIFYRVYANSLSVRTNHLDASHGYFNGAALFCFLPGYESLPIRLQITLPHDRWQITTPLPAIAGMKQTFWAEDFDTLVDSPVEMGTHRYLGFEVLGKHHAFAIWGEGNLDTDQLLIDTRKIIQTEADLFDGLPYNNYTFLLHLSSEGYGGLEHKNSCTLNYGRFNFREPEKYQRFLQLVAHEFFHLWNIKRIRPKALETFDYNQENYTPSLWFAEGTTSYYDLVIPLRAGIYDGKVFLGHLSKEITRYLTTPGRLVQPLAESSFDAWIKLYRRDSNSDNSQISYYLKGELVTLLLDLIIRDRHQNQHSFDDVLRLMWQDFGQSEIGFTPEDLEQRITRIAGLDLGDFFQRYLYSTEELPLDDYLNRFGLEIKPVYEEKLPYLGIKVQSEKGIEVIKFVASGSPAAQAGLDAEDQLLAMNGIRVSTEQLNDRLKDYRADDMIQLTVFHQDRLSTVDVRLASPQASSYEVVPVSNPSPDQVDNLKGWLGLIAP